VATAKRIKAEFNLAARSIVEAMRTIPNLRAPVVTLSYYQRRLARALTRKATGGHA
jgi:hypothetical protein